MIKVSIIVPVYNLENFISKCVDSLLSQTFKDLEIILVDDGSTDSSSQICDNYAKKDSRVKVIHQENKGLSGARNSGIEFSRGKWFIIVDGDDWLEPTAVENLYINAEKNKSDIFIASFFVNNERNQKKDSFFNVAEFHYSNKEDIFKLQENCISCNSISNKNAASNMGVTWARIYLKEFIVKNNLKFIVGLKRTQDAIFNLYALEFAKKVDFLDVPVQHYRIWSSSASRKYSKDFHITAAEIISNIRKFMSDTKKQKKFEKAYNSKVVKLLLEIVKLEIAPKNNKNSFKKKRFLLKSLAESDIYNNSIKKVDYATLTSGQKFGCLLLKYHMYYLLIILYAMKGD